MPNYVQVVGPNASSSSVASSSLRLGGGWRRDGSSCTGCRPPIVVVVEVFLSVVAVVEEV